MSKTNVATEWPHEFDGVPGPAVEGNIKDYCSVCDFAEWAHYRASWVAAERQLALVYLWALSLLVGTLEQKGGKV